MIQRLRDWLHERTIRRIGNEMLAAMGRDDNLTAGYLCQAHIKAIKARSPQQIARMERARELR
ncbi:hypothetical protein [Dyella caseinilytica]|uniref:Uncharacterized protein n=1 Tax=Dyella caseinilytica TaxID=1849581 RepID=A0ABX7GZ69_9GAMM|nr:hypothetical protein [Dyella caseinilytica]QRN55233.1 hypothetical protein ISN74_07860 [Dyella caseinilytica]GGA00288.1 hypothetical protein GCM10011408_21490 [Dyella caseinilytica]